MITGISWNAVYALVVKEEKTNTDSAGLARERDLYQERSVFTILGILYAMFAAATLVFARDSVNKPNSSPESENNSSDLLMVSINSDDSESSNKQRYSNFDTSTSENRNKKKYSKLVALRKLRW